MKFLEIKMKSQGLGFYFTFLRVSALAWCFSRDADWRHETLRSKTKDFTTQSAASSTTIILPSVHHVFLGQRSDPEQSRSMLVCLCCNRVTRSLRNPLWPRGRHCLTPQSCCKYNLIDIPERKDWSGIHNIPRRRKWHPTPVFLPGESQEWRSLVGCRLWGRTESDTTEVTSQQQQQHNIPRVSLQCRRPGFNPGLGRTPGKGIGNPLQYSCLENPTDRGAQWASVHGVEKSQTRLSN